MNVVEVLIIIIGVLFIIETFSSDEFGNNRLYSNFQQNNVQRSIPPPNYQY